MKNCNKKKLSLEKIQISKIKDLETIKGGETLECGWSVLLDKCPNGGDDQEILEEQRIN